MTTMEEARNRVKEADALRAIAMFSLRRSIVDAKRRGVPITQIARRAGVSRQTVYTVLSEETP